MDVDVCVGYLFSFYQAEVGVLFIFVDSLSIFLKSRPLVWQPGTFHPFSSNWSPEFFTA